MSNPLKQINCPVEKIGDSSYYLSFILPEAVFPKLRESMRTINGFFLFDLGQIWQLTRLVAGEKIQSHLELLGQCLYSLRQFVEHPDNRNDLPDSVCEANQLIDILNSIINRPTENIVSESRAIIHTLARFRALLNSELGKIHTAVFEERGGYSVATLWHNPLKAIDPNVVPFLSDFVKTNIEEAGKCLIVDRFTAVGFHAMRSLECVARRYYELITGNSPPYKNKKGDEYFKMLGKIAQELIDKQDSLKKGNISTGNLSIIAPIIKALCKIYRDPLSHPEILKLDDSEARTTFSQAIHVISMMVLDAKTGGKHFLKAWTSSEVF